MAAQAVPRERDELAGRMTHIDELVAGLDGLDPTARAAAEELLGEVMALHGDALRVMLDAVAAQPGGGAALLDAFAADELVRTVLLIHELHPQTLHDRVEAALESVRPMLRGHKGDIELLGIDDDVVRLRLRGSCDGCPSSELTMKAAVETALYEAAPEIAGIEVESAPVAASAPAIDCLVPLPMAAPRAATIA